MDKTFIGTHEDDANSAENTNLPGWPLDRHGFSIVSIPTMYFDLLLSYKIERRVVPGETDTSHALAVISDDALDLSTLEVAIDRDKMNYISSHGGGYRAAGLEGNSSAEMADLIRARIGENYIYELEVKEHDQGETSKFNLMLEFPGTRGARVRMQATMEYLPTDRTLRLITLY